MKLLGWKVWARTSVATIESRAQRTRSTAAVTKQTFKYSRRLFHDRRNHRQYGNVHRKGEEKILRGQCRHGHQSDRSAGQRTRAGAVDNDRQFGPESVVSLRG